MGSAASLPTEIDEETAKSIAGAKFDKAKFDAAAKDGKISKADALKIAAEIGIATEADQLTTEELVVKIRNLMPNHLDEKDAIRDHVAKCLRAWKVTGADLADFKAVRDLSDKFEKDEEFKKLMVHAETAARGARVVLHQLLIDMAHPNVAFEEGREGFQRLIKSDRLAPVYNAMYEMSDQWVIASGEQKEILFSDGTRVMHGFYVAPRGWYRLGIEARPSDPDIDVHKAWHKAYHGTGIDNIAKIINEGFKGPGDEGYVMNAGILGAAGQNIVYVSPSIEYAAHWLYSSKNKDQKAEVGGFSEGNVPTDTSDPLVGVWKSGQGWVQFVLELRVNPSSYRMGKTDTTWNGNTLRGPHTYYKSTDGWPHRKITFDKWCLNQSLEWLVPDARDNVVVTGVMIRWLDVPPVEHNRQRMRMMTTHVDYETSDPKGTMRRPRNHGDVEDGKPAAWEFNNSAGRNRNGGESTLTGSAWARYDEETSEIIELAYQQYQRVVFLGLLPRGAPEAKQYPYYIDFMDWCDDGQNGREQKPKAHRNIQGPMQHRADESKTEGQRVRSVRRVPK